MPRPFLWTPTGTGPEPAVTTCLVACSDSEHLTGRCRTLETHSGRGRNRQRLPTLPWSEKAPRPRLKVGHPDQEHLGSGTQQQ